MKRFAALLAVLGGCTVQGTAAPTPVLTIGDGQIDGGRIAPYEFTWKQCSVADGAWVDSGTVTEQVVAIGDDVLRLRQTTPRPGGPTTVATSYFERASFAPLRMELDARLPDGAHRALSARDIGVDGYTGWSALRGPAEDVQGAINRRMLHGGAMGLPLATLGEREGPLGFAASMMNFDATYDVVATWQGTETLEHDGRQIEAQLVDVKWHHRESGDEYPPGPDASGGRYWLVPNPPAGFPYVPRYKTDTYAVEFVGDTCP